MLKSLVAVFEGLLIVLLIACTGLKQVQVDVALGLLAVVLLQQISVAAGYVEIAGIDLLVV